MKMTQIVLSTLVLIPHVVWSAPGQLEPETGESLERPSELNEKREFNDALSFTILSEPEKQKVETVSTELTFYKYDQMISPRIGLWSSQAFPNWDSYSLGFSYMFPSENHLHWEVDADLYSNSSGIFAFNRKWIFTPRSVFRPYFKAGILNLIDPSIGLGNFLKLEAYYIKLTGGFEKLISDPMSFKLDIEGSIGVSGYILGVVIGYSWGW